MAETPIIEANKTETEPKKDTRFKPGCSGGPGRPKSDLVLREFIKDRNAEVWQKIYEMALEGNSNALRIWAERSMPALSSVELKGDEKGETSELSITIGKLKENQNVAK